MLAGGINFEKRLFSVSTRMFFVSFFIFLRHVYTIPDACLSPPMRWFLWRQRLPELTGPKPELTLKSDRELLYRGDYSDFINQQNTSDLRTAPPKTTQDPQWWYDDDDNVIWAEETPKPSEGTDIGQSSARSIADRYLSTKYAKFSQQEKREAHSQCH